MTSFVFFQYQKSNTKHFLEENTIIVESFSEASDAVLFLLNNLQ